MEAAKVAVARCRCCWCCLNCDDEAVVHSAVLAARTFFQVFGARLRRYQKPKPGNPALDRSSDIYGWTPRAKNSLRAKSKAPATGQYTPKPRNDNTRNFKTLNIYISIF